MDMIDKITLLGWILVPLFTLIMVYTTQSTFDWAEKKGNGKYLVIPFLVLLIGFGIFGVITMACFAIFL